MLTQPLRSAATRGASIVSRANLAPRSTTNLTRSFLSTTASRAAASHDDHGHESHYDPPGGWLWGVPPGEKRKREGWEIPFYLCIASIFGAVIIKSMQEDTSIQTWALEEARRRLEKEGILEDPSP